MPRGVRCRESRLIRLSMPIDACRACVVLNTLCDEEKEEVEKGDRVPHQKGKKRRRCWLARCMVGGESGRERAQSCRGEGRAAMQAHRVSAGRHKRCARYRARNVSGGASTPIRSQAFTSHTVQLREAGSDSNKTRTRGDSERGARHKLATRVGREGLGYQTMKAGCRHDHEMNRLEGKGMQSDVERW